MKTLKLLGLLAFITLGANAQDLKASQVPASTMANFKKNHPQAKGVEWEMKGSNYKVEFDLGKYDHEITYDANGRILKLEKEADASELPAAISNVIKAKYPDYKIHQFELTEWDNNKRYRVEIKKGWLKERKLVFDKSYKLLSDVED